MTDTLNIGEQVRAWRVGADMSGAALAEALGISKGKVSELEKGVFRPGVRVALDIERISGGAIDAAELNEDVRAARHGLDVTAAQGAVSPGNSGDDSRLLAAASPAPIADAGDTSTRGAA